MKLSSTDNADLSCKREESLDGVVTKIDMKPKTVQCAIKRVYASLWNTRAIEERSFARIDHATAAMELAVVPTYDTESEVAANGVLITRAVNSDFLAYTVGLQQENSQVTNPDPGTTAQLTLATFGGNDHPTRFTTTRFTTTRFATPKANAPPLTAAVIPDAKLNDIVNMTIAAEVADCRVKRGYCAGDCRNVWLVEAKPRSLDLKQLRELHGDRRRARDVARARRRARAGDRGGIVQSRISRLARVNDPAALRGHLSRSCGWYGSRIGPVQRCSGVIPPPDRAAARFLFESHELHRARGSPSLREACGLRARGHRRIAPRRLRNGTPQWPGRAPAR